MVGTPNVDKGGEAAVEFILVISDIRRKIGRIAVLTDENVVLELKIVDVLLSFALGEELICEDFLVLVPDRAVLLVGQTLRG